MKILSINLSKLFIVWAIAVLTTLSCSDKSYSHHNTDQLVLINHSIKKAVIL